MDTLIFDPDKYDSQSNQNDIENTDNNELDSIQSSDEEDVANKEEDDFVQNSITDSLNEDSEVSSDLSFVNSNEMINTNESHNTDEIVTVTEQKCKSEIALRRFLSDIQDIFPKSDKKKTQTLKLHQTKHYPNYIRKNGAIANSNGGGASEENMKTHVTNPGRNTQQRNKTLAYKISMRYVETLIVDIGHNIALNSNQYGSKLFCNYNNLD